MPDAVAGGHLDLLADEPLALVDAASWIALEPVVALGVRAAGAGTVRITSREDPLARICAGPAA
ncbi:hypothetical protein [Streptomyces griseoviridis]|uniref:hypothetical protein n=1 Tax=Streptomyces griseoviridis TaxID=45398 RepID=UPI0033E56472